MCSVKKHDNIFYLTLTGDDQHLLNPTFISSIRSSLSEIKSESAPGSVLITLANGKYFSNGFDAKSNDHEVSSIDRLLEMVNLFKQLITDFISLPMPTIACVTGHAAAAGLILTISHDYVLMRRDRGVLCMSEIDLGLTLPEYFVAMIRSKFGKPEAIRDVVLRGVKVNGDEAVSMGLVHSAHDSEQEVVEASVSMGQELVKRKWDGEVYGEIRKSLYPELRKVLGLSTKDLAKIKF
ncbi:enoyl-CoA delta isomerase 2, peroxisomal-like [Rutidosis leptorrhynchoides]|uniref:enoyl-CoA delta isomerase 2, peroxisomal-like n=1 Tax=Rutidosis leptorrhynchoides TaxID=125765 RepID=UPI003A996B1D